MFKFLVFLLSLVFQQPNVSAQTLTMQKAFGFIVITNYIQF